MGFIKEILIKDSVIGIWKLEEDESFFNAHLNTISAEPNKLEIISHPQRRLEWLSARWLAKIVCDKHSIKFNGISNDNYNKPHLVNSDVHLSLSHAQPYVTCQIDKNQPCGIDVESIREKLIKLAPKFLSSVELEYTNSDLTQLAILWAAKEAIYKQHGRKSLSFKEDIVIDSFNYSKETGKLHGRVIENGLIQELDLVYEKWDDFVLVYTVNII